MRKVVRPRVLLLGLASVAVLGVGCMDVESGEIDEPIGELEEALYGGNKTTNFGAVGYVYNAYSQTACTGTLIGPRTVLTAGHCIHKDITGTTINHPSTSSIDVYFGADQSDGFSGTRYDANALVTHPSFGGGGAADIAIIKLSQSVSMTPITVATDAPFAGEPTEVLGYGEGEGFEDQRQLANSSVGAVNPTTITWASGVGSLCFGDSGGPSLAQRDGKKVVIGVHSGSSSATCGAGTNYDMRVDAYLDWILSASGGDVEDPNNPGGGGGGGTEPIDPGDVGGCQAGGPSGAADALLLALLFAGLAVRRRLIDRA